MLVAFLQGCAQDNSRFEIAKNFVADIKEGHKTDIEIITQYLAADTATRREKLQILSMLFSAMRNGQLKSMDVNLLEATEYSEQLAPQILVLTEEEKRNIIFITTPNFYTQYCSLKTIRFSRSIIWIRGNTNT
jgi:hypothetical protein